VFTFEPPSESHYESAKITLQVAGGVRGRLDVVATDGMSARLYVVGTGPADCRHARIVASARVGVARDGGVLWERNQSYSAWLPVFRSPTLTKRTLLENRENTGERQSAPDCAASVVMKARLVQLCLALDSSRSAQKVSEGGRPVRQRTSLGERPGDATHL
jgi:hypothetical protein